MEDSISGIAVIKRFYALRDDHGLWDIGMELDLITPEQETIHYSNHTGIDKGSDDVVTEYFEKLKKIGLPDSGRKARQYRLLLKKLDDEYDNISPEKSDKKRRKLEEKLSSLNKGMTDFLKGKAIRVQVTPWPLVSGSPYDIEEISPYQF